MIKLEVPQKLRQIKALGFTSDDPFWPPTGCAAAAAGGAAAGGASASGATSAAALTPLPRMTCAFNCSNCSGG